MQSKFLKVWQFADAPARYRKLSRHGGDENLVIYWPNALLAQEAHMALSYGAWETGWLTGHVEGFGIADWHELDDGSLVGVFAHA